MKVRFIIICLVGCVLAQCTSPRPKYYSISEPDYNSRVKVTKPRYKQKLNAGGFVFTMGLAGAGGYLGYNSNLIQYNDKNNEVQTSNIAGLVGGAIVGYGIGSLINYIIFKQGQTFRINEKNGGPEKWVRRYDKDYQLVPTNGYGMMMIRRDAETKYVVKSFDDFIKFSNTFPHSKHFNRIVEQVIPLASRNELVKILEIYPDTKYSRDIKLKYINQSPSLDSYISSLFKYEGIKENPQSLGFDLIKGISDIKRFKNNFTNYNEARLIKIANKYANNYEEVVYVIESFPENRFKDKLLLRIKNDCTLSELSRLINRFPEANCNRELKIEYVMRSKNAKEFLNYNKQISFLDINGDLTSLNAGLMLVKSIESKKMILGASFSNKLISDVKENIYAYVAAHEIEKNMVEISGGSLRLGCTPEQNCEDLWGDGFAERLVYLSDFELNKYEVTQAQWRGIMGSDPVMLYNRGCDRCPVEYISWYDVQKFIKKLNLLTGREYRLPSELEWEYAARGGQKSRGYIYSGSNLLDEVSWWGGNKDQANPFGEKGTTRPVGGKKANELGLYDMTGNVAEWCSNKYDEYGDLPDGTWGRSIRGAAYYVTDWACKVSFRNNDLPGERVKHYGFRLAR